MKAQLITLSLVVLFSTQSASYAEFGKTFSEPFEDAVNKSMGRARVPGLAIAIVHNGEEVYANAFGMRNVDTQTLLESTDLFHWASVTKPFVATAAMQLVEQGKLDLDAPVTDYLPYFRMDDPDYEKITSRMLLTHTAGMPDVNDYEWDNPEYDDEALERWVRSQSNRKLLFPPTSGEQYSNIGFEVMGDVIAKVSGLSFEDFVAQHIFKPLQMNQTTLLIRNTEPSDRVSPHTVSRRVMMVREHWPYNRRHAPSSTVIGNVHDLGRWAMANLNHGTLDGTRILSESAYEQLWKPTVDIAPNRGLSWSLGEYDGHRMISHMGGDDGFRTGLILLPDLNVGIAIAVNSDRAPVESLLKLTLDSVISAARE